MEMINQNETIAAISTAASNSGIGIIRLSGQEAIGIISRIFKPAKKKDIMKVPSFTMHYGNILEDGKVVDEVLVSVMRSPHTYTREDVVEINCHGGVFVLQRILDLVIREGARPAEPGEFTKRAFLNGRIDLVQAEAVIDVINAQNNYALRSAVTQLKGSISDKVRSIRERLIEQLAYIEAALDDPEHIEMDNYGKVLMPIITECLEEVFWLVSSAEDGRILKEGIKTVILGKPNVGKSSLLNELLGQDRAIVTDIAGTTRDALEESLKIKDIVLNIIDTAGIRRTENVIEQIGVDKAKEYARDADLIIFVMDGSRPLDENDFEILSIVCEKKVIGLVNKKDLGVKADVSELRRRAEIPVIEISIKEKEGIEDVVALIEEMFYKKEIDFNNQVFITNARQKNSLEKAAVSLRKVQQSIRENMPEDFFTIDMMEAYEQLGSVIGETIEDDLAEEIFSKFCMGK
ncbi:MAG: tRNA uridine-5-carboxymethylaminomethyl(34) synthesis GTPase MnmE [Lachnospiraceae bacterium]|jgi:tRNA modification GTPase